MTRKHRARRSRPNFGSRFDPFEHNAAVQSWKHRSAVGARGASFRFVIFDEVSFDAIGAVMRELDTPYRFTPTHGGFDD